mgnify:CR=1 FL=1
MTEALRSNPPPSPAPRVERDELRILGELVPLDAQRIIELGCGSAYLARKLLARFPRCRVTGLEVDAIQHAKNLAAPAEGLTFIAAGAQAIPLPDAQFDLALMLKSLHHVPMPAMDQALAETRRVLRPGGHLYVSEPVYAGALNEVMRLFNDEGEVRAAAQEALDRACASGAWERAADVYFGGRLPAVAFARRHFDEALRRRIRRRFEPHGGPGGAQFPRPMHACLLRKPA